MFFTLFIKFLIFFILLAILNFRLYYIYNNMSFLFKFFKKKDKRPSETFSLCSLPSCIVDIILCNLYELQLYEQKEKLFKKYNSWINILASRNKLKIIDEDFIDFFKNEFNEKHWEIITRNKHLNIPNEYFDNEYFNNY